MQIVKYGALVLAAVAAVDLLFGDTGKSPLPDFLTNKLTQQDDLVLLGAGLAGFFLVK